MSVQAAGASCCLSRGQVRVCWSGACALEATAAVATAAAAAARRGVAAMAAAAVEQLAVAEMAATAARAVVATAAVVLPLAMPVAVVTTTVRLGQTQTLIAEQASG